MAIIIIFYVRGLYVFGHELGHIMGAHHDPDNSHRWGPDSDGGGYFYGHGSQFLRGPSKSTGYRTILA